MNRKNKIYNLIKQKKSLFIVGKSDSGKTFFIKRELIPFLNNKRISVSYFSDCDQIVIPFKTEVAIIDEVETFQDKEFLEKNNTTEKPYYSKQYIQKVNGWFKKLNKIKVPSIYIVTRKNENEVKHFQKTIKATDWDNRKVEVMIFFRRTPKTAIFSLF
ncbi:MAG: hypothetical protein V1711_00025 [bacterium]